MSKIRDVQSSLERMKQYRTWLYAAKSRYGPGNRRDFLRLTPRGIRRGARETALLSTHPDANRGRPQTRFRPQRARTHKAG
jgi:hypothetical protein